MGQFEMRRSSAPQYRHRWLLVSYCCWLGHGTWKRMWQSCLNRSANESDIVGKWALVSMLHCWSGLPLCNK